MVATENYFPEVYNDFLNFIGKEEQKIYTEQLFAQFEKMYNRKLSSQEKDMIKLAYIMGKTNQFSKQLYFYRYFIFHLNKNII